MIIRTFDNKLVNIKLNDYYSDFQIYQVILYLKYNIILPNHVDNKIL